MLARPPCLVLLRAPSCRARGWRAVVVPVGAGRIRFGAGVAQVLDVAEGLGEEARDVVVEELVADAAPFAVVAHETEVAQQPQLM